MKLDRNLPGNLGRGKYALVKMRPYVAMHDSERLEASSEIVRIRSALATLEQFGMLDYGDKPSTEFFVIRVKDKYAAIGLEAYAMAAVIDDPEYAEEIMEMAARAGPNSPFCKSPD